MISVASEYICQINLYEPQEFVGVVILPTLQSSIDVALGIAICADIDT